MVTSRPRILRAASAATCDDSDSSFVRSTSTAAISRPRASASLRWAAAVRLGQQRLLARVRLGPRHRALAGARPACLGQGRVGARQPLLRVGLQPHRLLAVALHARHPLGPHAQVRLPEELPENEHQHQEDPELQENRSVDVDELRLVRLGSRRK